MEILLLSARPDTHSNRRLVEAAGGAGVSCRLVDATRLTADTHGAILHQGERLVPRVPDRVLARVGNWRPESLLALLETLTAGGATTPNPAPAIRRGRDHWRTAQVLSQKSLPVPVTIAGADPEVLAVAADRQLGFPVVVKQRRSRMGVGVIRCSSADHLEAVLDSLWRVGDEIVVQQYVETAGRSHRLLVVGGEVVAAARFRAAHGEWRSNAARGGSAVSLDPDGDEIGLAVAASRAVGLGICGVDLLPGEEGTLICEVNPTPGFRGLEEATGIDVAGAIVAHLATPDG
jgi:RimK family alpha-L-glutamate ligase